jgi:hypothetical protein
MNCLRGPHITSIEIFFLPESSHVTGRLGKVGKHRRPIYTILTAATRIFAWVRNVLLCVLIYVNGTTVLR